jgi:hypothetical protein
MLTLETSCVASPFVYKVSQTDTKKAFNSMYIKMKRSRLLWWVLCAAAILLATLTHSGAAESSKQSATAQQTSKLDSLSGFRGQKFGTPFSEFQGLTLEKDKGAIKLYSKKDDNLTLGRTSS